MPQNPSPAKSFWEGASVRLRPYTPADAELIYAEQSDSEAIRLHHRLGFVEEGRLRRNVYSHGRYWDEICLGLTREEFDEGERQAR